MNKEEFEAWRKRGWDTPMGQELRQRLDEFDRRRRAGLGSPTAAEFFASFWEVAAKYRSREFEVPEQMSLW